VIDPWAAPGGVTILAARGHCTEQLALCAGPIRIPVTATFIAVPLCRSSGASNVGSPLRSQQGPSQEASLRGCSVPGCRRARPGRWTEATDDGEGRRVLGVPCAQLRARGASML